MLDKVFIFNNFAHVIKYLIGTILFLIIPKYLAGQTPDQAFCVQVAEHHLTELKTNRATWQSQVQNEGGYFQPRSSEIYLAALCANNYLFTKDEKWLKQIADLLVEYANYQKLYKFSSKTRAIAEYENGLPVLPAYFPFPKYVFAYSVLKKHANLDTAISAKIEGHIIQGADFIVRTQEWGPQNRAALRAEGLLAACAVIDDDAISKEWLEIGNSLLRDNLNNWSVEDASMYRIIWLYSITGLVNDVLANDLRYANVLKQARF
ncbi:MAG: hypothetical protein ACI959_002055, partial [Limisphaerales bacterium]